VSEFLIPNVGPVQPREIGAEAPLRKGADGGAFEKALRGELAPAKAGEAAAKAIQSPPPAPGASLKFSAHALNRIKDRSISMSDELKGKLEKAVDTAAQKGSKESLILSNDAAFIVSVKNKTVITVLDRNQMSGNVFTNIDSTVVI
jgi:flagellar operon protein